MARTYHAGQGGRELDAVAPAPVNRASSGPGAGLRSVVVMGVMVVAMMMVPSGGERRRSNQHQQQGSEHDLLHALTLAPRGLC